MNRETNIMEGGGSKEVNMQPCLKWIEHIKTEKFMKEYNEYITKFDKDNADLKFTEFDDYIRIFKTPFSDLTSKKYQNFIKYLTETDSPQFSCKSLFRFNIFSNSSKEYENYDMFNINNSNIILNINQKHTNVAISDTYNTENIVILNFDKVSKINTSNKQFVEALVSNFYTNLLKEVKSNITDIQNRYEILGLDNYTIRDYKLYMRLNDITMFNKVIKTINDNYKKIISRYNDKHRRFNVDGLVDIVANTIYDDTQYNETIINKLLKSMPSLPTGFHVGDKVAACYKCSDNINQSMNTTSNASAAVGKLKPDINWWYIGTIKKTNNNNTFIIKFDDGDEDQQVAFKNIFHINPINELWSDKLPFIPYIAIRVMHNLLIQHNRAVIGDSLTTLNNAVSNNQVSDNQELSEIRREINKILDDWKENKYIEKNNILNLHKKYLLLVANNEINKLADGENKDTFLKQYTTIDKNIKKNPERNRRYIDKLQAMLSKLITSATVSDITNIANAIAIPVVDAIPVAMGANDGAIVHSSNQHISNATYFPYFNIDMNIDSNDDGKIFGYNVRQWFTGNLEGEVDNLLTKTLSKNTNNIANIINIRIIRNERVCINDDCVYNVQGTPPSKQFLYYINNDNLNKYADETDYILICVKCGTTQPINANLVVSVDKKRDLANDMQLESTYPKRNGFTIKKDYGIFGGFGKTKKKCKSKSKNQRKSKRKDIRKYCSNEP